MDAETTGTDPYTDRIVSITLIEYPSGQKFSTLVNPGCPIPAGATEVHGITDEMVKDAPAFSEIAAMVQKVVVAGIPVTFNGRRFDTPLVDAELRRAGQPGFPRDETGRITAPEIDIYQLWIKAEPRTLVAAVERFAGRTLDDAHSSEADTEALPDVLEGLCEAFGLDAEDAEELCALTRPEEEIDRDGKFRKEGGTVVFTFGKHQGEPVKDHLDFIEWMLRRDFGEETKSVARWLLNHYRTRTDQTEMGV